MVYQPIVQIIIQNSKLKSMQVCPRKEQLRDPIDDFDEVFAPNLTNTTVPKGHKIMGNLPIDGNDEQLNPKLRLLSPTQIQISVIIF